MSKPHRKSRGDHTNPRARQEPHWELAGGVPWPELGDGTPWRDGLDRVRLTNAREGLRTEEGTAGRLHNVEWCHPDGAYMKEREKVRPATKTLPERREPNPGEWYGIVAWDDREAWGFDIPSRVRLVDLVPE